MRAGLEYGKFFYDMFCREKLFKEKDSVKFCRVSKKLLCCAVPLIGSVLLIGITGSNILQGKSMQQCPHCICNEYLDNNISALFTSAHFRNV